MATFTVYFHKYSIIISTLWPFLPQCFTIAGDQAYSVPTFRYYSSDKTAVRYLMADVQDQIFTMENEEKQLEADIKTVILKVTLFSHFLQFSSDASGKN